MRVCGSLLSNSRILNTQLLQVGFVPCRIVVVLLQLRRELFHLLFIQFGRRLVRRIDQRLVFDFFGLNFIKLTPACFTSSGFNMKSSAVMAWTLAPAVEPLW